MAEHSLRVEAVVLRHSDWGEADRLLTLFTRERAKLRCVAKGVRKLNSRKAGHLEPFTRVALMLARGRDFWIVTQAETLDAYLPLGQNLLRTGYASYVLELVDRFSYEGDNSRGDDGRSVFALLVDTLYRLAYSEDTFLAVRYFEMRLLDQVGYRPNLTECVQCNEKILPRDQYFSAERGGVLCPKCGPNAVATRPVSLNTLKFLRHFQRSSWKDASRAHLTPAQQAEMESLLQFFLTYLLERGLNTPDFLREVRRSQADQASDQESR